MSVQEIHSFLWGRVDSGAHFLVLFITVDFAAVLVIISGFLELLENCLFWRGAGNCEYM